jgi:beta-phosphoglucomutase
MEGVEALAAATAVIFDMDGVLIDSMPLHAQAWLEVLGQEGIRIRREDVYEREGEAGAASLSYFFKINGLDPAPEHLQELVRRKETLYKQRAVPEVFPGVFELLASLKNAGKRMAIVTGTARHELEVTLPKPLLAFFETVVTGDEVRRGKPDPEPYLTALSKLGISAANALVVENAPLGVRAAKAAGLCCFAVETSMQCPRLVGADRCFADLLSLAEFLLGKPLELRP